MAIMKSGRWGTGPGTLPPFVSHERLIGESKETEAF